MHRESGSNSPIMGIGRKEKCLSSAARLNYLHYGVATRHCMKHSSKQKILSLFNEQIRDEIAP